VKLIFIRGAVMKKILTVVVAMLLLVSMTQVVMAEQTEVIDGVTFPVYPRLPQVADEDINRPQPVNTEFSDMHYVVAQSSGIVGVILIAGSFLAGPRYSQPIAFVGGGLFGTSACLGFGL
jgi:hypothetical protein